MNTPAAHGQVPARSEVITLGETMLCLSSAQRHLLANDRRLSVSVGGAESNTAIGLRRLGIPVTWISVVGQDAAGEAVMSALAAEGVDLSHVRRSATNPTGLMIRQLHSEQDSSVTYYRASSAASTLNTADIDTSLIERAPVLHLTGINLALGDGPRQAALRAMSIAKDAGVLVTFDPNHRPRLWSSATAAQELRLVLPFVDHLLCNEAEARLITGADDIDQAAAWLLKAGPGTVIIKRGREGCIAHVAACRYDVPAWPVERPVDPVGAGDAFNAGWIYGHLRQLPAVEALHLASWVAAHVVAHPGDYEGFPAQAIHSGWRDHPSRVLQQENQEINEEPPAVGRS